MGHVIIKLIVLNIYFKVMIVNLEIIRAIVTAEEVLLLDHLHQDISAIC